MPEITTPMQRVLVVHCDNPGVASRVFGDHSAYAHPYVFAALAPEYVELYRDLDRSIYSDMDSKAIPFREFAMSGQLDNKTAEPYGVEYGYVSNTRAQIITPHMAEKWGKPLALLERTLAKLDKLDGPAMTWGHKVARVARAMKAERLILMPPRPWNEETRIHLQFRPDCFGESVWYIDQQIAKAHKACRVACGQSVDA